MMTLDKAIEEVANALGQAALEQGAVMTTAESCTAGGISYAITAIPGSSAWFDRAFVTYSNAAKKTMLDVKEETLLAHGAVSEAVVAQMTEGALHHSEATLAVAVSGIAGPGGAVVGKPVGTAFFSFNLDVKCIFDF